MSLTASACSLLVSLELGYLRRRSFVRIRQIKIQYTSIHFLFIITRYRIIGKLSTSKDYTGQDRERTSLIHAEFAPGNLNRTSARVKRVVCKWNISIPAKPSHPHPIQQPEQFVDTLQASPLTYNHLQHPYSRTISTEAD